MKRFILAFFLLAAAVFVPSLAYATAEAVNAPGVIDLTGLAEKLGGYLWAGLALLAGAVWLWLKKKFGLDKFVTDEQFQKLVAPLLDEAVAYGVGQLTKADWLKIETKNEAVEFAVEYALEHGGDLLAKFGVDEDLLRQKLEAKLVQNGWDTKPGEWQA